MSTATTDERSVVDAVDPRLYVGGRWRQASGGRTLPVEDPATGETLCEVADATVEDARSALDAAVAAQAEIGGTVAAGERRAHAPGRGPGYRRDPVRGRRRHRGGRALGAGRRGGRPGRDRGDGGGRRAAGARSRSRTRLPARPCARSPTPPWRTRARRWTPRWPPRPGGRRTRPASAARSCAAPTRRSPPAATTSPCS